MVNQLSRRRHLGRVDSRARRMIIQDTHPGYSIFLAFFRALFNRSAAASPGKMRNIILYIMIGFLIFVLLLNLERSVSPAAPPPRLRRRVKKDEAEPEPVTAEDDELQQSRIDVMDDTQQEEEFPLNPKDPFRA